MNADLLVPGYAGALAPDELERIRGALRKDRELSYQWGWQRGRRTFPPHLVQLIAMHGDMESRTHNSRLLRSARATRRANAGVGNAKYGLVENATWETEGLVRQVAAA